MLASNLIHLAIIALTLGAYALPTAFSRSDVAVPSALKLGKRESSIDDVIRIEKNSLGQIDKRRRSIDEIIRLEKNSLGQID